MEENNFKIHKEYDFFDVEGRRFKLNSYDPMEGNYLLFQLFSFVLPFGIGSAISKKAGTEKIPVDTSTNKMMSKNDFILFETDVLKTVEEVYKSGESSPVVRENGTYGIMNYSMGLFIQLIIASLAFNFKDFFDDLPSIKDLIPDVSLNHADTKI